MTLRRAGTITWSLAGTDAALFTLSSNGALTFKEKPNYEMAVEDGTDNMYEVIVQATDAASAEWAPSPLLLWSPTWTSRGW